MCLAKSRASSPGAACKAPPSGPAEPDPRGWLGHALLRSLGVRTLCL